MTTTATTPKSRRRLVPVSEHAVLIGAGQDPRSRANHECAGVAGAFCPACDPAVYAALASRHSSAGSVFRPVPVLRDSRPESLVDWS